MGRIVVKDGGDLLSRKCIGGIPHQWASFTYNSISHHHPLDNLHLGISGGAQGARVSATLPSTTGSWSPAAATTQTSRFFISQSCASHSLASFAEYRCADLTLFPIPAFDISLCFAPIATLYCSIMALILNPHQCCKVERKVHGSGIRWAWLLIPSLAGFEILGNDNNFQHSLRAYMFQWCWELNMH